MAAALVVLPSSSVLRAAAWSTWMNLEFGLDSADPPGRSIWTRGSGGVVSPLEPLLMMVVMGHHLAGHREFSGCSSDEKVASCSGVLQKGRTTVLTRQIAFLLAMTSFQQSLQNCKSRWSSMARPVPTCSETGPHQRRASSRARSAIIAAWILVRWPNCQTGRDCPKSWTSAGWYC